MKYLVFICITMFLYNACIVITPSRSNNDAFDKFDNSNKDYKITYIEVSSNDILLLNKDSLYLFATWCPACYVYLSNLDPLVDNSTALISLNYNINILEDKLVDHLDTVYILKNSYFGSVEKDKISKFVREITSMSNYSGNGVPLRFAKINDKYHLLR